MRLEKVINTAPGAPEAFRVCDLDVDLDVLVFFTMTAHGVSIVGVDARGDDITSDDLRGVLIGDIRKAIYDRLIEHPEERSAASLMHHHGWTGTPSELAAMERASKVAKDAVEELKRLPRDRRRQSINDETEYRQLAEMYIDYVRRYGRGAIGQIASELARNRHTVYWQIKRCRELHWLGPGEQGKAKGTPGEKLLAWWESNPAPELSVSEQQDGSDE